MKRLNNWYDNLKEPYRFLFAMTVLAPIGPLLSKFIWESNHPITISVMVLYSAFIISWAFYRAFKN